MHIGNTRLKWSKLLTLYIPLMVFFLFIVFPFYWIFISALKRERDMFNVPLQYLPSPATLENYVQAWKDSGFAVFFRNSFLVSGISVCLMSPA